MPIQSDLGDKTCRISAHQEGQRYKRGIGFYPSTLEEQAILLSHLNEAKRDIPAGQAVPREERSR